MTSASSELSKRKSLIKGNVSPAPPNPRSLRRNRFSLNDSLVFKSHVLNPPMVPECIEENEDSFLCFFTKLDDSDIEDEDDFEFDNLHFDAFIEKDGNTFRCKVCSQKYENLKVLRNHVFAEIKGPQLIPGAPLIEWEKTTKDLEQIDTHMCFICDIQLPNETDLREHEKIHGEEFKCDLCQVVCTTVASYEIHRSSHFQASEYLCPECERRFDTKFSQRRHIREDHFRLEPEKFQCPYCNLLVTDIVMHAKIHRKTFHKCDECKNKFRDKDCLAMHAEIHEGKDSFKCVICDRSFVGKKDWVKHIGYHEHGPAMTTVAKKQGGVRRVDKKCGPNYVGKCLHEYESAIEYRLFAQSKECDTSDLKDFVRHVSCAKNEPKRRRLFR